MTCDLSRRRDLSLKQKKLEQKSRMFMHHGVSRQCTPISITKGCIDLGILKPLIVDAFLPNMYEAIVTSGNEQVAFRFC